MDPSLTSAFLHLMHLPIIDHINLSYNTTADSAPHNSISIASRDDISMIACHTPMGFVRSYVWLSLSRRDSIDQLSNPNRGSCRRYNANSPQGAVLTMWSKQVSLKTNPLASHGGQCALIWNTSLIGYNATCLRAHDVSRIQVGSTPRKLSLSHTCATWRPIVAANDGSWRE